VTSPPPTAKAGLAVDEDNTGGLAKAEVVSGHMNKEAFIVGCQV
jgi:hypothetical protein